MPDAPMLPPRYPRIVTPVANHLARKEIERQWRAKGQRITRYATIVAQAQTYLLNHPELFEQALARVRASPWHSMMAEREEPENANVASWPVLAYVRNKSVQRLCSDYNVL